MLNPQRYRPHLPTPSSPAYKAHPVPILLALKHASLHGATKSLGESRAWMVEHIEKFDNWFYAVFERIDDADTELTSHPEEEEEEEEGLRPRLGCHVGSVSLRRVPSGPELLPPLPGLLMQGEQVGSGSVVDGKEAEARAQALKECALDARTLGYALFAPAQGKGYATEAARALLDAYKGAVQEWRGAVGLQSGGGGKGEGEAEADGETEKTLWYVEAGVDVENPGSQRVLRKLGFRTVGMKIQEGRVWLNGAWRGPGWWITGLYL